MNSAHEALESAVRSKGYLLEQGGVCSSASLTGLHAFLNKNLPNLNSLIKKNVEPDEDIDTDEDTDPAQEEDIVQDTKAINVNEETDPEENLLRVLSLAQIPHYYPQYFPPEVAQQASKQVVNVINHMNKEQGAPMTEITRWPGIFTESQLVGYLLTLKYYATKHKQNLGLYLGSSNHAMALGFDVKENQWEILNINNFPFPSRSAAPDVCNLLFKGFNYDFDDEAEPLAKRKYFPEEDETVAFETIFFSLEKDFALQTKMLNEVKNDPILNQYMILPGNTYPASLIIHQGMKTTPNNTTLAYIAARNNHADIIQILAANNINLTEAINDDGTNALYIAAQLGNLDAVKALIAAGVPINSTDQRECTPLYIAAQMGHVRVVEYLLKAGAKVAPPSDTAPSALFAAALENHTEVAKLLLEHGADPHQPITKALLQTLGDAYDISAKMTAFIKQKMEAGAKENQIPISAYEIAALTGHNEVLSLMDKKLDAYQYRNPKYI